MADTFNFPCGGYEVRVLRKEDVLACIDSNIIDKDVALAIVKKCEIDAANFLREGRWAGIPFIGNIRIPKTVQNFMTEETKAIFKEAEENLDRQKYILFRKQYSTEVGKRVKIERYYRYVVSRFVGRNQKFFKNVSKKYGDEYARFLCYTLSTITPNNNFEDYEQL